MAAVLPKNTDRWPAAPEKFWPVMVIVLPAEPLVALKPVTDRRQVHDLEVAGGQRFQTV